MTRPKPTRLPSFARLAALVTGAAHVPPDVIGALKAAKGGDEEAVTAVRQKFVVSTMLAAGQALPASALDPVEKTTAATMGDHWSRLGNSSQQMLVTAEYFGGHAPKDADHSGPLLGLAAACEATMFDFLIRVAAAAQPGRINATATFGQMIRWVNDATYPNTWTAEGEYLREFLSGETALDLMAIRSLVLRFGRSTPVTVSLLLTGRSSLSVCGRLDAVRYSSR